ncbi:MAG: hypothetical protein R3C42_02025 [Parvularculaceae bacterium]|nr:hypothetical protein [Parvularculaceae bacterium]
MRRQPPQNWSVSRIFLKHSSPDLKPGFKDAPHIKSAITAKLPYQARISLSDTTLGGQNFKKIDVAYDFDFLVKFSKSWSGVTITATRYAPAL